MDTVVQDIHDSLEREKEKKEDVYIQSLYKSENEIQKLYSMGEKK